MQLGEKIGDASLTYYDYKLINGGEITEIDPEQFTDQSNLFREYYIFAGFFLLAPALLVIFGIDIGGETVSDISKSNNTNYVD